VVGLRRRYLEALQANLAARGQYDALRKELDELQTSIAPADAETETASEEAAIQEYIALLRQRQRHGRLDVIQRTLSRLLAAEPNPVKTGPRTILDEKLGEPLQPPTAAVPSEEAYPDVEALVFKLKREVLAAKRSKDQSSALQAQAQELAQAAPEPTLEAEAHALSCARDELVNWIEGELVKISDSEVEVPDRALPVQVNGDASEDEGLATRQQGEKTQELYNKYITARTSLIARVNAVAAGPSQPPKTFEESLGLPVSSPTKTLPSKTLSTHEILPYIPSLLQISGDERSLIQQSTYLRRQLANASAETARTIRRLAGESHLVAPDAGAMSAWAAAAEASSARTETFVREQLQAGETHIAVADQILADLRARRETFGRLDGTL